jgi:hypothetical protein
MGGWSEQLSNFAGAAFTGEELAHRSGRKAKHEVGIGWFAPWEQPFAGFPEHARRSARALADAGGVVHLRSHDAMAQIAAFSKEMNELQVQYDDLLGTEVGRYGVFVNMFVPTSTSLQMLVSNPGLDPEELVAVNSKRVVYTVWERQSVPDYMIKPLTQVGEVWVACHDNVAMLGRCGVPSDKLRVVPVPYFPDDPHLALEARTRDPKRPVCFYSIGKWEPRKDQHRAMLAFMQAFRPFQCAFVVKTSRFGPHAPGYPKDVTESVAVNLRDPEVIRNGWTAENVTRGGLMIVTGVLPDDAILNLHRLGDCYVSLSHGEGFDMPAFDAKLSGNMMLYTPSGGPQDFAGEWDVQVTQNADYAPCNIWYQWGKSLWLDHDVEQARRGFLLARERVLEGKRSRGMDPTRFSSEVVGREMLGYLEELAGEPMRKKEKET